MAAIGDADGTVSMMSLCRALYDQTLQPKEKEIMATIFEREFRREKNLEMAKRQAEQKKPVKKDNTIVEKKAAALAQQLHELEDGFFKHVAEDAEALSIIKKRGEGSGAGSGPAVSHEKPKEEVKQAAEQPKPAQVAGQPKKPAGQNLPVGEHVFKGSYTQDGQAHPLEFVFHVEEGGIISSQADDKNKFSLNGIVQDGKLTLKQQFEGDKDAEFDGEFDAPNSIKGHYKSVEGHTYPFELKKV